MLACEPPAKLVHRDLPGFAIDLPDAKELSAKTSLEYATGSIAIQDSAHARLAIVAWSAGPKLTPAELEQLLGVFGALVHASGSGTVVHEPGPQGAIVETIELPTDSMPLFITQLDCGRRNVMIALGAEHGAAELRKSVLASFRCTPDPTREAKLGTVALHVRVDLPGWKTVSQDGGQLVLTDQNGLVMMQPMPLSTETSLVSAIGPMLKVAFQGTITAGPVEGNHVPLQGTIDGQPAVGFGMLIPCAADKTLVFALASDRPSGDAVQKAFDAATCTKPGEPAPSWPAAK